MAHTSGLRGFKSKIYTRMSRMDWSGTSTNHTHVSTSADDSWGVPADHTEVVPSGVFGLQYVRNYFRDEIGILNSSGTGFTAGGLTVILGGANPERFPVGETSAVMDEIDMLAKRKRRSVVIVPGENDQYLVDEFNKSSMYDSGGYLDWGIKYGKYQMIGVSPDVSCYWNRDNEFATVIIPANPTVAGLLKVKTIMKKADVMISHHRPYENIEHRLDQFTEEQIQASKLVTEATRIWDPDLHIFPNDRHSGLLYTDGDKRAIGLRRRKGQYVVRLLRGDLNKGPVLTPMGYGEYPYKHYYKPTQGE